MANQLEDVKVWLIMDATGKAYGLPSGVVFYSWSSAQQAFTEAKEAGQLPPVRGLRIQPMVAPPIRRRHER